MIRNKDFWIHRNGWEKIRSRKQNMAIFQIHHLKMYFLLKMGIFPHCSVRCSLLECNEPFLLARAPAYTCAAGWTGKANHSCMIDRSDGKCAVPVPLGKLMALGCCWVANGAGCMMLMIGKLCFEIFYQIFFRIIFWEAFTEEWRTVVTVSHGDSQDGWSSMGYHCIRAAVVCLPNSPPTHSNKRCIRKNLDTQIFDDDLL